MASLLKGKQMAQRRLGLYRQVPQGCKSDTSIELPGVRQIQACAKTDVVPLPLALCFCPSVKGCSGQWACASAIPAPGNSQVWHRVRAGGCMCVPLTGQAVTSASGAPFLRGGNNQT